MATATTAAAPGGIRRALGDLAGLSARHWYILAVAAVLHLVDCFDLIALGFAGASISRDWGISPSRLGLLFSAANLGGIFGSLVVAGLATRVDRKPLYLGFVLLVGAGSLATAFAHSFELLLVCRAVTGFALAAVLPVLLSYAIEFQPAKLRATATAVIVSAGQLGFAVAGVIAAIMIPMFGWHSVFIVGGVIPLVMAPIIASFPPSTVDLVRRGDLKKAGEICARYGVDLPEPRKPRDPAAKGWGRIEQRHVLPLVAVCLLMSLGSLVSFFTMNWIPTLFEARGLSIQQASLAMTAKGFGGIVGILLCGFLMDRMSPYFVLTGAFVVATVAFALLSVAPPTPWVLFLLVGVAGGAVGSGVTGAFGFTNLMFPHSMRVGVLALLTWLARLSGMIAPAGAGFILAAGGSGSSLFFVSATLLAAATLSVLIPGLLARRALGSPKDEPAPQPR